ncbi:MAG: hypothetical protein AAFW89_02655 [Bacteroidota bacterium]
MPDTRNRIRFFVCLWVLIFGVCVPASAFQESVDKTIGVRFGDKDLITDATLEQLRTRGIQFIEIPHTTSDRELERIAASGLEIWVNTKLSYLTPTRIAQEQAEMELLVDLVHRRFESFSNYRGLILSEYSAFYTDEVLFFVQELAAQAPSVTPYIRSGFPVDDAQIRVIRTAGSGETQADVIQITSSHFEEEIIQWLEDDSTIPLIPVDVFLGWMDQSSPDWETSFSAFAAGSDLVLPRSQNVPASPDFNWPVFVLLGLWISLAVHVRTEPTYRGLLFRYFTGNRFFVDDIMQYRDRSVTHGVFLIIQHAVFAGLIAVLCAYVFISEAGLSAFFDVVPSFLFPGKTYASFFIVVGLMVFLVELIGLLWLYVPSRSLRHVSQVLSLYSWNLHLNFVIVTAAVTAFYAGFSSVTILVLTILFVLNWYMSFNLTAWWAAKYQMERSSSYLGYTIGIHTVVSLGTVSSIFFFPSVLETLELVLRL